MNLWVIKNSKTGQYSDGAYGWTGDIAKAVRYKGDAPLHTHDHIGFVPYEQELSRTVLEGK